MNVSRILLIEGTVNVLVALAKALVGLHTGSAAILADALHSATDVANNIIAFCIQRISRKPADASHPYGHRKFEYLGIFVLAVLLCVVAVELVLSALSRISEPLEQSMVGLVVLILSVLISMSVSWFESSWANKLKSKLLEADAKHTFSDGLTTLAAILGWQLSLLGIAGIVLYLAVSLFQQAVPILVDQAMISEKAIQEAAKQIPGVIQIRQVRSRSTGHCVAAHLTTQASHQIAHHLEADLSQRFKLLDVIVHVEPY